MEKLPTYLDSGFKGSGRAKKEKYLPWQMLGKQEGERERGERKHRNPKTGSFYKNSL